LTLPSAGGVPAHILFDAALPIVEHFGTQAQGLPARITMDEGQHIIQMLPKMYAAYARSRIVNG